MRESSVKILMAIALLATFAFAAPLQQSDKPSTPAKQDKSSDRMTKGDKHDQSSPSDSMRNSASGSTLDSTDRHFVMEAAHGGMMEVSLGRIAVEKGANPDVKQFAQRMVDDHSKANAELQQLASQKGIALPAGDMAMTDQTSTTSSSTAQSTTSLDQADSTSQRSASADGNHAMMKAQTEMNKLGGLSGNAFDRQYISMMVKDHEKDVKEFEKQSTKAKDPDIRAWAAKTLPTLREHLQQVRDLQSHMKSGK